MGGVAGWVFSERKECLSCEVSEGHIMGLRFLGVLLRMILGSALRKVLIILL